MAHPEAHGFLTGVKLLFNRLALAPKKILEVGSFDVNGSARTIFANCNEYMGIDLVEGPGVDLVYDGKDFAILNDKKFDFVYCTEVFEHDPFWANTSIQMHRFLDNNGTLVFTCASRGRPEHGTSRTDPTLSPGTTAQGIEYYRNLSEYDFRTKFDLESLFKSYFFVYNPSTFDLYFIGTKRELDLVNLRNEICASIPKLSLMHFIARLPLYLALKVLKEPLYNNFSRRYWNSLYGFQKNFLKGVAER